MLRMLSKLLPMWLKKSFYLKKPPRLLYLPVHNVAIMTFGKSGGTSIHRWYFEMISFDQMEKSFVVLAKSQGLIFATLYHILNVRKHFYSNVDDEFRVFVRFFRKFANSTVSHKHKDVKIITITRHPYQRTVSAFLEKLCTNEKRQSFVQDLLQFIQKSTGKDRDQINFLDYIEALHGLRNEICSLNGHWAGQACATRFFRSEQIVNVDIDNLASGLTQLGFNQSEVSMLSKRNKQPVGEMNGLNTEDCLNLSVSELKNIRTSTGFFPRKEKFLTDKVKNRIRMIYSSDFEIFDYAP